MHPGPHKVKEINRSEIQKPRETVSLQKLVYILSLMRFLSHALTVHTVYCTLSTFILIYQELEFEIFAYIHPKVISNFLKVPKKICKDNLRGSVKESIRGLKNLFKKCLCW